MLFFRVQHLADSPIAQRTLMAAEEKKNKVTAVKREFRISKCLE